MKKSIFALSVLSLSTISALNAQTLFTVGKEAIDKNEFIKIYSKNAPNQKVDYSQKAVDEYIDLYSLFKMKVSEAKALKIDTIPSVKQELENYKLQLANTYLTDKSINDNLTKEAYDRLGQDVDVSHILLFASPNGDTTSIYKKIDSIYNQINTGKMTFEKAAQLYSEDKSTSAQDGNIGFITAFNTVYGFENAAYNTPVGQVSKPFRTQYGYHIVKVLSRKKSEGEYTVQQILLKKPSNPQDREATLKVVADIKNQLKNGASFDDLVIKYSSDKFSTTNKGILEPFRVGKNVKEFDEAVLKLKKAGDVSEAVETKYGFHIIKLIDKKAIGSFESMKAKLYKQVESDDRAEVARKATESRVKKENKFTDYTENLAPIVAKFAADTNLKNDFNMKHFSGMNKNLFSFSGKTYTQKDFLEYATKLTRNKIYGSNPENIIKDLYKMYQEKIIKDVQIANLEKNNTEFKALLGEYNDGILLFEYMEREVWNKASTDTAGLNAFYQKNSAKYQWNPSFKGKVFQSANKEVLGSFRDKVLKGQDAMKVYNDITLDPNTPAGISMDEGRFDLAKFKTSPSDFVANKPTPLFLNGNSFTVVIPSEVYQTAQPKTLEEARGYVVADYQEYLDKELNSALKKKYPLKVEEKVLKTIVK